MPVASTSKRKLAPATKRPATKTKATSTTVDDLADKLAATLTLTKGKPKDAYPRSDEEIRHSAMRAINAASQALGAVVRSGWKAAGVEPPDSKANEAAALALAARRALVELRNISPEDTDVERAASSVAGKLLSLEMHTQALEVLVDMHSHLYALCRTSAVPDRLPPAKIASSRPREDKTGNIHLSLISLPLPSTSSGNVDTSILLLLSTFLSHALIAVSYGLLPSNPEMITSFVDALRESTTLVSWIPTCTSLPPKHVDGLLTRSYTALTKASTSFPPKCAEETMRVRSYALSCLLLTSPSTIQPGMFWEQAVKFGVAFTRGQHADHKNGARFVASVFSDVVSRAEQREDRSIFLGGLCFLSFCEYWLGHAKAAGDIQILDRIAGLMHTIQPSPSPSPSASITAGELSEAMGAMKLTDRRPLDSPSPQDGAPRSDVLFVMRKLCASFAQMTTIFETLDIYDDSDDDLATRLRGTTSALKHCRTIAAPTNDNVDEEYARVHGKMRRAVERLQRAAVRVFDLFQHKKGVQVLLAEISHALGDFLLYEGSIADDYTSLLDTLFVLARTTLVPSDPTSVDASYTFLSRAASALGLDLSTVHHQHTPERPAILDEETFANFLRCVSGALHTLGGTLYQVGKYGSAIRFLRPGCVIGGVALRLGQTAGLIVGSRQDGDEVTGKQAEAWRVLEGQLTRRWELLGVCYSKIGDRKQAHEAFVESITSYPFGQPFVQSIRTLGPRRALQTTPALKQLSVIVDRVTYMAACELIRAPKDVSLQRVADVLYVNASRNDPKEDQRCIIGALIERQIDCLEGSLWKEGVPNVVEVLLRDAVSVYDATNRPIRRAGALLRGLEFSYHAGRDSGNTIDWTYVSEDIESLLGSETFGLDIALARTRPHLQAATCLWSALHAHSRRDTKQTQEAVRYAQDACRILKTLLVPPPEISPKAKKPSPKSTAGVRKGKEKIAPVRVGATAPRKQVPKTPRKAVPSSRLRRESGGGQRSSPKIHKDVGSDAHATDDWQGLVPLMRMVSHLVALLGQALLKVQLLRFIRLLCDRTPERQHDDYIKSCTDLAHEYAKLGKIKKAASMYNRALASIRTQQTSDEVRIMFLLRYTESLAVVGDVPQSEAMYKEALSLSDALLGEEKNLSTAERIQTRANRLERAALAASVFAQIQLSKDDTTYSIMGLLQSLRLWNRATSTLSRLELPVASASQASEPSNPFQTAESGGASPPKSGTPSSSTLAPFAPRNNMSGLQWQIAEGLFSTLLALAHAYFVRGSPREAEYFAQQAEVLANSLNAPVIVGRALAKKGEIQIHLGQLDSGHESLTTAAQNMAEVPGPEAAEIRRLLGEHSQLSLNDADARNRFAEAVGLLEELDKMFTVVDGVGPRRSSLVPPSSSAIPGTDILVPPLLSSLLRHQIWLLRDEVDDEYHLLMERLLAMPSSVDIKAEEHLLLAKLSLHGAYDRFRENMFLNSLTESVISLPMGMTRYKSFTNSSPSQEILHLLNEAEELFQANLTSSTHRGPVPQVREASMSLALIQAFQSSLGKQAGQSPVIVANLLDAMASVNLRREVLEVIPSKFPGLQNEDDLRWPVLTKSTSLLAPVQARKRQVLGSPFDSGDDDEADAEDPALKAYWESLRAKYRQQSFDVTSLSQSKADRLPSHWTVIHVCVTEDKSSMIISRQRASHAPIVFCLPLKGRRETEEDEHLTFEDALTELNEIVRLSDEATKQAVHVKKHDQEARAVWWAGRMTLDKRLQELLASIEFCWLGAFKTILSAPVEIPLDALADLRNRLEKIFKRSLVNQDKKQKIRIRLEDTLLECISMLSPKCRDEELEDLVYFILDLYQFHGVQVAIAEVDVDHVIVELRTTLEDHATKMKSRTSPQEDSHMFLVLDKNVQGIPWESIPILRGRSVSRIPSIDFLVDRLDFAKLKNMRSSGRDESTTDRAVVDASNAYYVLNPSGDLGGTERRFAPWLKSMEAVGWEGVVGQAPSEQQLSDALSRKDMFIYFGHGGGEQYIRSHKIRHLPRCAATMLWGCSSGILRDMGDFDRIGTPYNYMLAGCPTLVANLWDVTDRDIDKFTQSVFDKIHLTPDAIRKHPASSRTQKAGFSIVTAVAESRDVCKLKYLTGAAPVIYGIPFYL